MRLFVLLALTAVPAHAWEFTADPICTISHQTETAHVSVTYDPSQALPYSIAVRLIDGTWPQLSPYAIRFDGPNGFMITTDRHQLSDDKSTVIASDTGFGNVLDGLEKNMIAAPQLGNTAVAIPLGDAPVAVRKFRDCTVPGLS